MCKAILETLKSVLAERWTPETARAWADLWEAAMAAMGTVGPHARDAVPPPPVSRLPSSSHPPPSSLPPSPVPQAPTTPHHTNATCCDALERGPSPKA